MRIIGDKYMIVSIMSPAGTLSIFKVGRSTRAEGYTVQNMRTGFLLHHDAKSFTQWVSWVEKMGAKLITEKTAPVINRELQHG